ncbi:MAG: WYL domain-containing protein [Lachnospiraceae bacterium]|nr:WYL domain-containing protein [Lachnospiraceae bacterium]
MNDDSKPKKLLILYILEILKNHTDENHSLDHKDILRLLKTEYGMTADRKSIRNNLDMLINAGFDILYDEVPRVYGADPDSDSEDQDDRTIKKNFRFEREITDSELRLLIDSILFSKNIPGKQRSALIKKLESLSSTYFSARVKHITTVPFTGNKNKELFYNIDVIDEAISAGKQLEFNYLEYHTDQKLHPRITHNGKVRRFSVNPYYIAATNGRYYLICNNTWFSNVTHFRIDRITNIRILEDKAKPMSEVKGLEKGFSLSKHMAEHIYMFSDEAVRVKFRVKKQLLSELFDWFAGDMTFSDETEDELTVSLTVSEQSMELWAIQFAKYVTVLSPQSLVDKVGATLREAAERYEKN